MRLHILIQPLQYTDSRRMHPTTQLNTPNSLTRGTPESRRCSWSNPLPRECSRISVLVMVVCRQPLYYWVVPSSKIYIATATPWPSGFLHSHPLVIPYPYMLASTVDKRRGSLTHSLIHHARANRSPYVPLRAVYPIFGFFKSHFV